MGWQNTIMWFGGVGCGLTTLLFFYSPVWFGGDYWAVMFCGVLWGGLLAGYVPLWALVPSSVNKDKVQARPLLHRGPGQPVLFGSQHVLEGKEVVRTFRPRGAPITHRNKQKS